MSMGFMRYFMMAVSFLWVFSEIALAILKRSKENQSRDKDKSSLRVLWGTIIIAVSVGVYTSMNRLGHIYSIEYFLSIIGLTLIVLGLILRWIAILTLRRYFTVDVSIASDHKIIDKGLYSHIRHPAYLGSLLSFLGLGISFSNWISLIIIFVPITGAFIYRIKIEEAALLQAFGNKYRDYSVRTRRLIPGIF
jgi:protein-S-isoprenylcysteine O-methyltransferase Ste14